MHKQLFCRRLRLRVARMAIEKPRFDEFMKLDGDSKRRYLLEIASIDGVESVDPYSLKGSDFSEDTSVLPPLRSELLSIFCLFCIGFRFVCFTQGGLLLYISLFSHRDITVYLLRTTSFITGSDDYKSFQSYKAS